MNTVDENMDIEKEVKEIPKYGVNGELVFVPKVFPVFASSNKPEGVITLADLKKGEERERQVVRKQKKIDEFRRESIKANNGYLQNEFDFLKHENPEGIFLKRDKIAYVGDYIVKDVDGLFYPYKANLFEQTYEEV